MIRPLLCGPVCWLWLFFTAPEMALEGTGVAVSAMDWIEIQRDWLETGLSYRKLAEKHGVSLSTLKKVAAKNRWTEQRDLSLKKGEEPEPGTGGKMEPAAGEDAGAGKNAENQGENRALALRNREEPVPAAEEAFPDGEWMTEEERRRTEFLRLTDEMARRIQEALVKVDVTNVFALKMLASALMDLRELQGIRDPLEEEEIRARIAALKSRTRGAVDETGGGVIYMPEIEACPEAGEDG